MSQDTPSSPPLREPAASSAGPSRPLSDPPLQNETAEIKSIRERVRSWTHAAPGTFDHKLFTGGEMFDVLSALDSAVAEVIEEREATRYTYKAGYVHGKAEAVQPSDTPAPAAVPDPPHVSEDYREVWASGYRAALASSGAASQASQWHPISTAPKGETILGGAYYKSLGWLWDKADYRKYPALKLEGWTMRNGLTPTHWMPLPDPPAASVGDPQK